MPISFRVRSAAMACIALCSLLPITAGAAPPAAEFNVTPAQMQSAEALRAHHRLLIDAHLIWDLEHD